MLISSGHCRAQLDIFWGEIARRRKGVKAEESGQGDTGENEMPPSSPCRSPCLHAYIVLTPQKIVQTISSL